MSVKIPTQIKHNLYNNLPWSVGRTVEYYGILLTRLNYVLWKKGFCRYNQGFYAVELVLIYD